MPNKKAQTEAPTQPAAADQPAPSANGATTEAPAQAGTAATLQAAAPPAQSDQRFTLAEVETIRRDYETRLADVRDTLDNCQAQLEEAYNIVGRHSVTISRLEKAGLGTS